MRRIVFWTVGLIAGLGAAAAQAASPSGEAIKFRVHLDGKPIGHHSFTIRHENGKSTVDIEANFDVRFLFVTAYRYRHRNTEVWKDGCLSRIESQTDVNGKPFAVTGRKKGGAFDVSTLSYSGSLDEGCVKTFAYWDRSFLSHTHLLNAQTGEYVQVETEPLENRPTGGGDIGEVELEGYRIYSPGDSRLDIKVWYHGRNGRWMALESNVDGGRVLSYARVGQEQFVGVAFQD